MDPSLRCHGVNIVPGVGEAHGAHGEKVGDYHEGDVVPRKQSQTLHSNLKLSRSLHIFHLTLPIFDPPFLSLLNICILMNCAVWSLLSVFCTPLHQCAE